MARISEQIIEQIRSTTDIIEVVSGYVELKKKGRNFFGLCPFHGEKTASFSVNPQRQIYKCFGCGAGGGSINFIMAIENIGFVAAVQQLAEQYGIELQLEEATGKSQDIITRLFDIHEKAANYFLKNLGKGEGLEVLNHLEDRGLNRDTIKKFKLGYSPNQKDTLLKLFRTVDTNGDALKQSGLFIDTKYGYIDRFRSRIMFSIFNSTGKVTAFAGRVYNSDDPAKYVNSPETAIYTKSKILYGLHASKQAIRDANTAIVVEGYLDFLQLYQAGVKNIVAVSGTAFTDDHALQLKRFCNEVYLAYDGDKAGITAAIRAGYVLLKNGIAPRIVLIPDGLDPEAAAMLLQAEVGLKGARAAKIILGDTVLVTGQGPIGNFAAQLCKLTGAYQVIVSDLSDLKLQISLQMDIDLALNPRTKDMLNCIEEFTHGQGADVVVESSGSPEAFLQGCGAAAAGGRIVILGWILDSCRFNMSEAFTPKGLEMVVCHAGQLGNWQLARRRLRSRGMRGDGLPKVSMSLGSSLNDDYLYLMDLISQGKLKAKELITHRFPINDLVQVWDEFIKPSVTSVHGEYAQILFTSDNV